MAVLLLLSWKFSANAMFDFCGEWVFAGVRVLQVDVLEAGHSKYSICLRIAFPTSQVRRSP